MPANSLATIRRLLTGVVLLCAAPAAAVTGGSEIPLNAHTASAQTEPQVATSGNGFVVVWQSEGQDAGGAGVIARLFSTDGEPAGTEFVINANGTGDQVEPAVAMAEDGDFVVVWLDEQRGSSYSQAFESSGAEKTQEILLSTRLENFTHPRVAYEPGVGYLIVYGDSDGSGSGVSALLLDVTGVPVSGELSVNSYTTGTQELPDVAGIGDGTYVVAWQSDAVDGDLGGIRAARVHADGSIDDGLELAVNSYTLGPQARPRVGTTGDGGFAIVWEGERAAGNGADIGARVFDNSGDPVGTDFAVNAFTSGIQADADVAGTADGGFVVTWSSYDPLGSNHQDGSGLGVFGRTFAASGAPASGEFPVNVHTTGDQSRSSVRTLGTGFLAAWQSNGQDGSQQGIFGRLFQDSTSTTISVTTTTLETTTTIVGVSTTLGTTTTLASTTTFDGPTTTLTGSSTTTVVSPTTTLPTTTTLGAPTTTLVGGTTTTSEETSTTLASTTTFGATTTSVPATTTTSPVTSTTVPLPECGDPLTLVAGAGSAGANAVLASDALFILKTAVGTETCIVCVCDTSGDEQVTASDALIALRVAVGAPQSLGCPPCSD